MEMVRPRKAEWPRKQSYYVNNLSHQKDATWLKKYLLGSAGDMYISTGDAEHQVYSKLEEELDRAWFNNADIYFMAGPIINVPEEYGKEKRQEGREELNPVIRLAKEGKIKLYPSDRRQMPDYRVFEDVPAMNVLEPHAPGDKSPGSLYVYNSWVEAAPWISHFRDAAHRKDPVTDNFQDHFLFLTDKEIGELKKWSYKKGKDVNNIDLRTCREFWRDYIQ